MKKHNKDNPEEIKPDLKHDTMEYAASTDGDDPVKIDLLPGEDDDGISAEELTEIESDDFDDKAAALNSAETDRGADEDNFFDEENDEDEDDYYDTE